LNTQYDSRSSLRQTRRRRTLRCQIFSRAEGNHLSQVEMVVHRMDRRELRQILAQCRPHHKHHTLGKASEHRQRLCDNVRNGPGGGSKRQGSRRKRESERKKGRMLALPNSRLGEEAQEEPIPQEEYRRAKNRTGDNAVPGVVQGRKQLHKPPLQVAETLLLSHNLA
jgi:hypothetical protein